MLLQRLSRPALSTRSILPPTFLCPWIATIVTQAHTLPQASVTESSIISAQNPLTESNTISAQNVPASTSQALQSTKPTSLSTSKLDDRQPPIETSQSIISLLPNLTAQPHHYITLHLHARSYLVTQGDTIRLPFLMPNVQPGDILRLTNATRIGSRDYTLFPSNSASASSSSSTMTITSNSKSATSGLIPLVRPLAGNTIAGQQRELLTIDGKLKENIPHFIPHQARGKIPYIDPRMFVCRATVLGVESEPMRVKEKTKRRQRHVRKVKSKHRYTILKIKEVRVKTLQEIQEISDETGS